MKLADLANKLNMSQGEVVELLERERETRSRRQFLKQAAAAAAALPAAGLLKPVLSHAADKQEAVLIIGAGAAGLAAAYQFKKAGVPFRIVEASSRVGGRIWTEKGVNASNQFVERGAELVDTNHYTLRGLAHELMGPDSIEDFADFDANVAPAIFHFKGQTYTEEQFVEAVRPLVEVIGGHSAEIYGEEDMYINYRCVSKMPNAVKYDKMTIAEYVEKNKAGVEAWAIDAISVAYLTEYGMELNEQSALNLVDFIDTDTTDGFSLFGDSDESKRVKGGNQGLIDALAKHLELNEKNLRLNTKVIAVRTAPSGKLEVSLQEGNGTVRPFVSSRVLCTLPFTVLREIEGFDAKNGLALPTEIHSLINTMGYGTNTKIMMSFKSRFWRQDAGSAVANSGAAFGEFSSQQFWETSRLQAGENGILTNFSGGLNGLNVAKESKYGIEKCIQDLDVIYQGKAKENFEGKAVVQPWPIIPTSKGSYSAPKAGQYTTTWGSQYGVNADGEYEAASFKNDMLYFAGEHTHPLTYGFMNGAYSSGIQAANKILVSMKKEALELPGRDLIAQDAEDYDN